MARPVLITTGATRNPIAAMRHISAFASGRTGVGLATALAADATVHLLGHPEALARAPGGLSTELFGSTRDLMQRMEAWVQAHPTGIVVHAAAVGDYEVAAGAEASKIPSGQPELVVRLRPTPKILDHIRDWSTELRLVSFKAAAPGTPPAELQALATAQLRRSHSDLVFANVIGRTDQDVLLVDAQGATAHKAREAGLEDLLGRIRGWLA